MFIFEENQKISDLFKMLNTIPLPEGEGNSVYRFSDQFYKPKFIDYQQREFKSKIFIFAGTNTEAPFWDRISQN